MNANNATVVVPSVKANASRRGDVSAKHGNGGRRRWVRNLVFGALALLSYYTIVTLPQPWLANAKLRDCVLEELLRANQRAGTSSTLAARVVLCADGAGLRGYVTQNQVRVEESGRSVRVVVDYVQPVIALGPIIYARRFVIDESR